MKKFAIALTLIGILGLSNMSMADSFDHLKDITPAQINQLTRIHNEYKMKNDELENRISTYTNKINQIKNDTEKTDAQKSLLIGAYERNVETLKAQKQLLERDADTSYKTILNPEQYNEFKMQQLNADNAFRNFLPK